MIPWLDPAQAAADAFPPVTEALHEPNGLLAAGGALTPEWLLTAYRHGIFPWYDSDSPILWWSPDPRMVLEPANLRITRSLHKTLKSQRFDVCCDTAFDAVMRACAAPRQGQAGTWIDAKILAAYSRLYELGWAHCIESWQGGELVGGLYGVVIGRVFYGESMFHRVSDASKVAFAHLVKFLQQQGFALIDCQMQTPHLTSLGAHLLPRVEFVRRLAVLNHEHVAPGRWPADALKRDWNALRHDTLE